MTSTFASRAFIALFLAAAPVSLAHAAAAKGGSNAAQQRADRADPDKWGRSQGEASKSSSGSHGGPNPFMASPVPTPAVSTTASNAPAQEAAKSDDADEGEGDGGNEDDRAQSQHASKGPQHRGELNGHLDLGDW